MNKKRNQLKKNQTKPRWFNKIELGYVERAIICSQYPPYINLSFFREWNGIFYHYSIGLGTSIPWNKHVKETLKNGIKDIFCKFNNNKTFKNYEINYNKNNFKGRCLIMSRGSLKCFGCHKKITKKCTSDFIKVCGQSLYEIRPYCKICWEVKYQINKLKE